MRNAAPALARELLPGDERGVVVHRRDHHVVPRPDVRAPPTRGHEVHGLGGAAHEEQAVGVGDPAEPRHARPRPRVRLGRRRAQPVRAAVRVGVGGLVVVAQRVEHGARLLRRRRRVEVDERRIRRQQRELGPVGERTVVSRHDERRRVNQ
jgi:hypothetical protein